MRSLSSVPPQHGKTELISHAYIWLMLGVGADRAHAYVTYQQKRAREVSRYVYRLAQSAGLRPVGNQDLWYTPQGASFRAAGIDTGLTGAAVTGLLVIDDPHKNRQEAESPILRSRVAREFVASVDTRTHPTTSILVNHTRWHVEDLIGVLGQDEATWGPRINLPAIDDDGRALWPELHPIEELEHKRETAGEYDWWSLYMGQPRPAGASVFRDVQFYDALPKRYRVAIGIDLAVTDKTSSDYAAAVVLAEADGNIYVLDVRREHATVPEFAGTLRMLAASYPGSRMLWHASAQEIATAELLRTESRLPVFTELATAGKFVRALPVAAAWNAVPGGRGGRIFLPRDAPWVADFVSEVCGFTGKGDRHDDQVDALAAAYDQLTRGAGLALVKTLASKFGAGVPNSNGKGGFQW